MKFLVFVYPGEVSGSGRDSEEGERRIRVLSEKLQRFFGAVTGSVCILTSSEQKAMLSADIMKQCFRCCSFEIRDSLWADDSHPPSFPRAIRLIFENSFHSVVIVVTHSGYKDLPLAYAQEIYGQEMNPFPVLESGKTVAVVLLTYCGSTIISAGEDNDASDHGNLSESLPF